MENKKNISIRKYEQIYKYLEECFNSLFVDDNDKGFMKIEKVIDMVMRRISPDDKHCLRENALIEIPRNLERKIDLFETLKKTYLGYDSSYVSGHLGCPNSTFEGEDLGELQLYGITNMALLMYLSNILSKQYEKKSPESRRQYFIKNIALEKIIASIYVLSKTDEQYKDFFSYGNRKDEEGKNTFVIDLPYIGQLCVHYGWDRNRDNIISYAENNVKIMLNEQLKLKRITIEQYQEIIDDLKQNGVLPEYKGKLYEYVSAFPIEYTGENVNKCRNAIGNRLPEEITEDDIKKLREQRIINGRGLNERELYYFLIKIGAGKDVLLKALVQEKTISKQLVKNAVDGLTISEFKKAGQDMETLLDDPKRTKDSSKKNEGRTNG